MNLRETLEEVAANLAIGFSYEIDNAVRVELASISQQPALQDAGAEIAAALMGRPRADCVSSHPQFSHPPVNIQSTSAALRVIQVEPLRRLS